MNQIPEALERLTYKTCSFQSTLGSRLYTQYLSIYNYRVQLTLSCSCPASFKLSEVAFMILTWVFGCSACSRNSFCGKHIYLLLFSPWSKLVLGMQCTCPEQPAETTGTSGIINTVLSTGCGSQLGFGASQATSMCSWFALA